MRATLQWTLENALYPQAAWLIVAVEWFWEMRGDWYEKGRWLAQLLPHRQSLDVELRLAILAMMYSAARVWEEFQPIGSYTSEVIQLLEVCSNKCLQATAWFWLAVYSDDFIQAETAWEQAIASARAGSENPGLGTEFCLLANRDFALTASLWEYAGALIKRGEVVRATPLITESLEIYRARGTPYELVDSRGTLGLLALLQGDLAQAHKHLAEAKTMATDFNLQGMLALWQPLLGIVTLYGGDPATAHRLLGESLGFCLELKDKKLAARVCTYLAETALWENQLEHAAQWLAQSLTYPAESGHITIYEVGWLWVAARVATAQHQYLRAATLFGLAEQVHSKIHHVIAGPIRTLADAALATVRSVLTPAIFAEAFAAGQQMSLEQGYAWA